MAEKRKIRHIQILLDDGEVINYAWDRYSNFQVIAEPTQTEIRAEELPDPLLVIPGEIIILVANYNLSDEKIKAIKKIISE